MAENYLSPPYILSPGHTPLGMTLPRPSWVRLNRLLTGIELFRSTMHKWGNVASANCSCGAEEQTTDHILASCPLHHPPNGTLGLVAFDDDTVDWLKTQHSVPDDTKSAQTKIYCQDINLASKWS